MAKTKQTAPAAVEATPAPVAPTSPAAPTWTIRFSDTNVLRGALRQNLHFGGGGEPRWDAVIGMRNSDGIEGFVIPSVPERLFEAE